jgi:hypothetical protein
VECTRCGREGYTTTPGVAAVSRDDCVVCDAGYEGEAASGCRPCPVRTYKSIGFERLTSFSSTNYYTSAPAGGYLQVYW